ncbi:MAG: OmpH family outer membrane protein [Candidatus Krumholzibacteria bacterium]|nr:OmpH family outer membrane protein [Candidatus Krumholzibacteria bacterium]
MKELNRLRRNAGIFALVVLAVGFTAGFAGAADDIPLAVVDSQRIVEEYEAARDAQEQYQKYMRELELEVVERERELQALAEEIESQKMLLGQDALATKMQAFEKKKAEYFEFREGIDQRAEAEYKAQISPIFDQVKTILERIGKEKNYGLIVDSASLAVLYIDPDYDLTNEVLAALARGDD